MQNIHPIFVHFPLALLSVGLLFDVLGYLLKKQSLTSAGWWCFSVGVLSAIVTVFTGMQAEHTVKVSGEAHEILESHEHFQITSTVVFVVLWIWRCITREGIPKLAIIYFVITVIAVGAISYGAHYGGELVYEYGVGTAVQPPA
ncbi:DUF2231 domain-containing protein [Fischerella sp. JS2]|uniref:DUF2231 domain-containing protein n=1 Tax=Fischerella sp. JS2 TaxID=2597771 RepID=UPI0028ED1C5C|nr:DUF2231 domain-containing protein [Fischerella sp. JS2]